MKKYTFLWVDDCRDPKYFEWQYYCPLFRDTSVKEKEILIEWVESYDDFVKYISNNGLPDAIGFDHDLGYGKSGYDCAKWLVDYCQDKNIDIPLFVSQSSNPSGRRDIMQLLTNYHNFYTENDRP